MPQPSLDGSGMKDISDGLHTINTVQCLQLSGQLKPSPPHSDLSDTDLASGEPRAGHAGPVSPCHRHTGGAGKGWPLSGILVNKWFRICPCAHYELKTRQNLKN